MPLYQDSLETSKSTTAAEDVQAFNFDQPLSWNGGMASADDATNPADMQPTKQAAKEWEHDAQPRDNVFSPDITNIEGLQTQHGLYGAPRPTRKAASEPGPARPVQMPTCAPHLQYPLFFGSGVPRNPFIHFRSESSGTGSACSTSYTHQ